jgi:hypothetical protein
VDFDLGDEYSGWVREVYAGDEVEGSPIFYFFLVSCSDVLYVTYLLTTYCTQHAHTYTHTSSYAVHYTVQGLLHT